MTQQSTRTRLAPDERRAQLLDLGVRLFATRSVEEISIDVLAREAGVSRGLLYPYSGSKQAFRESVIRHSVDDLVAQTAPPAEGSPIERLVTSVGVYVEYVEANLPSYKSLVRAAMGGSEDLQRIYEEARFALTDRIFRPESLGSLLADDPTTRLLVRGWAALAEEMALSWAENDHGMSRDELVRRITYALPQLLGLDELGTLAPTRR